MKLRINPGLEKKKNSLRCNVDLQHARCSHRPFDWILRRAFCIAKKYLWKLKKKRKKIESELKIEF